MSGVVKFDHLYVETAGFDQALNFWKALGFSVAEQWGEDEHRACRLQSGKASVVLAETPLGSTPQGCTTHFAIEGAEELSAALRASGAVTVVTPLEPTHWGTRWIRVQDPDGNLYCLETQ